MTSFEHRVRERAYYIWEDEGRLFGQAESHWLRAETELQAHGLAEPHRVRAPAPALTLAASPAEVLAETLKAKPSRTRAVTATVEAKAKTASAAPKAAKATTKSVAKSAPAAEAAAAKTASKKTPAVKATKVATRPRGAEAAATVH